MFWKLSCVNRASEAGKEIEAPSGRFVLHRHTDASGPHLDLRLEQEGYLLGWRIDAVTLDGEPWATEKGPHPISWLEQDGDAIREDAGVYAWLHRDANGGEILLHGRTGLRQVRIEREAGLPPAAVRSVCDALQAAGAPAQTAARLIADGVTARRRAIGRLCGLGRELDGAAFDESVWRRTLDGLTLDEIHAQLRVYEVRFDQKYPPQPVSQPEPLAEHEVEDRLGAALAILRE